jgi:signal transduction histidine kinase
MFGIPSNLGLPRKVVDTYLLFSVTAICWLSLGAVVITHRVFHQHTAEICLAQLNRCVAALQISYLTSGPDQLSTILREQRDPPALTYVWITDTTGRYLAHTKPHRVGLPSEQHTGQPIQTGDFTGITYQDDKGNSIQEYQVLLKAKKEFFGTLHWGIREGGFVASLAPLAGYALLSLSVPLALIVGGAVVLSRLTRNTSDVERQLREAALQPPGKPVSLAPLPLRTGTAIGWNRLVEYVAHLQLGGAGMTLNERLVVATNARRERDLVDVMESLSEGIAVTDVMGRITFANRAVSALLDTDSASGQLLGHNLEACLKKEIADLGESDLFDPQTKNRNVISEGSCHRGDSTRVLRVARQPLVGDATDLQVWTLRDVTQQKLAEKMRDQFIDTATHELRTPLANIKAYAEMLATSSQIKVEQQKEFCNIINSEVTRLARLVDDLLNISSMEVGSLSAERQKVESMRLFEEVLSKVRPMMQKKDIQFEVRLPEKMGEVHLDKDKMVAVLVNLLGNAAKYTPCGGHVALKVKLEDSLLQIAVEDTGFGISAEELPHVFDKFFRSEDERVQAESGTGLGLSLAREVVQLHGGDITVESVLHQGSTFLVSIPVE